jgi:predicted dehydrogenase
MDLKPDEREIGKESYNGAIGVHRRDFLKGVIAAGAVSGAGLGAMYFGYQKVGNPVRIGIIGTGDEGNVLIGACNPEYVDIVAIADIRPSSIHRAFYGDYRSNTELVTQRPGIFRVYKDVHGWKNPEEAKEHVDVYEDYEKLLEDDNIEAVIIALPLHLHAKAAIDAMKAGKHVLTEKLMAHSVGQCKEMAKVAIKTGMILATGHQRHYSILYDNAVSLLKWGVLGELHYIRAQWHRSNLPGNDSWQKPLPGGEERFDSESVNKINKQLLSFKGKLAKEKDPEKRRWLEATIAQWAQWDADQKVVPEDWGYDDFELSNGPRLAKEELHRWRLWNRTGGGLMAELGSHQLDAASIFISALRDQYLEDTGKNKDGKKVHPLTVHAVGGRHVFPLDRQAADHAYCMFEFPAPGYAIEKAIEDVKTRNPKEKNPARAAAMAKWGYYDEITGYPREGIPPWDVEAQKKVVVTYSSTMGNGYGGYGEVVMGSKGTLVIEREQDVMLYKTSDKSSKVSVKDDAGGPTLDTQESGPPAAAAALGAAATGPVSRGYTEEIEHWAWCIRNPAPENKPKCHPEVALGDAVIALTTKLAIKRSNEGKGGYIEFKPDWFDVDNDATPEKDLGEES